MERTNQNVKSVNTTGYVSTTNLLFEQPLPASETSDMEELPEEVA